METVDMEVEEAVEQLQQLLERDRLDSARTLLAQVLPKHPDNLELQSYSMWLQWREDELDEARVTLNAILTQEPDHYFARYIEIRIDEEEDRYPDAEANLVRLLKDYPEDADLYAIYARIMLATNHFEKAEKLANEALRINPDNEDAMNASVLSAFVRSPNEETKERLQRLMQEYPDQQQTTVRLIQYFIDQGQHKQAYELSREMVLLQPNNQALVDMAVELKTSSHWSMLPLWPMQKFGWGGSIGLWLIVLGIVRLDLFAKVGLASWEGPFTWLFVGYAVYSWVWPSILKRLLK